MVGDLQPLVTSWRRHLRAANLSPRTITGYLDGPRLYMEYARRFRLPVRVDAIRRRHLEQFIADQLDRHTASTAAAGAVMTRDGAAEVRRRVQRAHRRHPSADPPASRQTPT